MFLLAEPGARAREGAREADVYHIVGVVNKEAISLQDVLARARLQLLASGQPISPSLVRELAPQALNVLVVEALQRQLAKNNEVEASEEEVTEHLKRMEKEGHMDHNLFMKTLENAQIPLRILKQQIAANIAWAHYMERRYMPLVVVRPEEIERHLALWKRSAGKPIYRLGEIVLYVDDQKNLSCVTKEARNILNLLSQGASFTDMASQFSQASSRKQRGLTNWCSLDHFPETLRPLVEKALPGQILGPVVCSCEGTPDKVMIAVVLEKKNPSEFKQSMPSKERISELIRAEALERYSRRALEEMRQKSVCRTNLNKL